LKSATEPAGEAEEALGLSNIVKDEPLGDVKVAVRCPDCRDNNCTISTVIAFTLHMLPQKEGLAVENKVVVLSAISPPVKVNVNIEHPEELDEEDLLLEELLDELDELLLDELDGRGGQITHLPAKLETMSWSLGFSLCEMNWELTSPLLLKSNANLNSELLLTELSKKRVKSDPVFTTPV
jgi:hypothetical protein